MELPLGIGSRSMRHLCAESILEEICKIEPRVKIRRDCRVAGLNVLVRGAHGLCSFPIRVIDTTRTLWLLEGPNAASLLFEANSLIRRNNSLFAV